MKPEDIYFRRLSRDELWQRYCGFLSLSSDEFMAIQKRLLREQIDLAWESPLARRLMGETKPSSCDEFRRRVPFTEYEDYEPHLTDRDESALAQKPYLWVHSSGRGGRFKWIPQSKAIMDKMTRNIIGMFILSSARQKGDIAIAPGMRLLTTLPPKPYLSGAILEYLNQQFSCHTMPPPDVSEELEFMDRIKLGFKMALRDGFDIGGAIASILVKMGEAMADEASQKRRMTLSMLHPKTLFRLVRARLKSRAENRGVMPKDLWRAKGILATGMDAYIYKEEIKKYWGVLPYDSYVSTEMSFIALQSWTKQDMTFLPDIVFLEFIPYGPDTDPNSLDDAETVLLDELEVGGLYEVVITQFHGMPLMRYRMRDLIRVVSLSEPATGIRLPQIAFQRKVDETINLGSLCTLDERTLWQALSETGVRYNDWTATKEIDGGQSYLAVYVELLDEETPTDVANRIDENLRRIDVDYRDIGSYLSMNPVRVNVLPPGTFARYSAARVREGADLAHLKPKHINPSDTVFEQLMKARTAEG